MAMAGSPGMTRITMNAIKVTKRTVGIKRAILLTAYCRIVSLSGFRFRLNYIPASPVGYICTKIWDL